MCSYHKDLDDLLQKSILNVMRQRKTTYPRAVSCEDCGEQMTIFKTTDRCSSCKKYGTLVDYLPTKEEISIRCSEIQSLWTPSERACRDAYRRPVEVTRVTEVHHENTWRSQ